MKNKKERGISITPEQAVAELKKKYPNDSKVIDEKVVDARKNKIADKVDKINDLKQPKAEQTASRDGMEIEAQAKAEAKKAAPKPKKEKGPTLAGVMDAVLAEGGSWESIQEKVTAEAAKLKLTGKVTAGVLRSHFKTRPGRDAKFANLTATEEGITITTK